MWQLIAVSATGSSPVTPWPSQSVAISPEIGLQPAVQLPDERIGLLMVFYT